MFAVIKAGGKQYRVAAEDVIRIDRVEAEPGKVIEFGEVLLLGGGDAPQIGAPTVSGAMVAGEVLQHTRGDKVIAFKKRRRKNSRRKRGHRQEFTLIRISEILLDGAKPTKGAAPKREPKPVEPPVTSGEDSEAGDKAKAKSKSKAKSAAKAGAAKKPAAKKPAAAKSKSKRQKK